MSGKHTPTPDNSTLRAPTAEEAHDMLMLRSVGAMAIAEGDEGWQHIPLDCPMLVAVAALRNSHAQLLADNARLRAILEARQSACPNCNGLGFVPRDARIPYLPVSSTATPGSHVMKIEMSCPECADIRDALAKPVTP